MIMRLSGTESKECLMIGPVTVFFGEADDPSSALKFAEEQEWDVVVLDISLRDRSGLEVLKDLKKLRPRLPVLILSMHSEEQYARRAFKAGASGYLTKDCSRDGIAGRNSEGCERQQVCQCRVG